MKQLNILKIVVNYLNNNGFNTYIRVNDSFLSGWGGSGKRKHVQIIACNSTVEAYGARSYFLKEPTYTYFNVYRLTYENINKTIGNRSYSIRNDFSIARIQSNIEREIDILLTNGETDSDARGLNLSSCIDILQKSGYGFREFEIVNNLKSFYKGHTWNDEHKVVTFESIDGATFDLDIVTGYIVG